MFKKLIAWTLSLVFSGVLLLAHGDATHLFGTVTGVSKDTVTIKDKDGKSVIVMLEKGTKYIKDKKATTVGDLKVGSRVVIDAEMDEKMKMFMAEEIQVGAAEPAVATKAPAKK